jgi:hypothetical protein
MTTKFSRYQFKKFPITFLYPSYAKYRSYEEKKYYKQVILREQKDKFRKTASGKIASIYPKLAVAVMKVNVPAYQTTTRKSYFMAFGDYIKKLVNLEIKMGAFPDMICEELFVADFWKGFKTIYQHPNNSYWRTEIYLHELSDDTNIVNILYRHIGEGRSDEELEKILNSFEFIPLE